MSAPRDLRSAPGFGHFATRCRVALAGGNRIIDFWPSPGGVIPSGAIPTPSARAHAGRPSGRHHRLGASLQVDWIWASHPTSTPPTRLSRHLARRHRLYQLTSCGSTTTTTPSATRTLHRGQLQAFLRRLPRRFGGYYASEDLHVRDNLISSPYAPSPPRLVSLITPIRVALPAAPDPQRPGIATWAGVRRRGAGPDRRLHRLSTVNMSRISPICRQHQLGDLHPTLHITDTLA